MAKFKTIHQGDINFIPLQTFAKPGETLAISRKKEIRPHSKRLLIQEGELTGHHHGVWFMPKPAMFREDGAGSGGAAVADKMLKKVVAKAAKTTITAKLYRDTNMVRRLRNRGLLEGAPVVGFLDAKTNVTIKHASEDGKPTGEHAPVKLTKGSYLVTGKREFDPRTQRERRVVD